MCILRFLCTRNLMRAIVFRLKQRLVSWTHMRTKLTLSFAYGSNNLADRCFNTRKTTQQLHRTNRAFISTQSCAIWSMLNNSLTYGSAKGNASIFIVATKNSTFTSTSDVSISTNVMTCSSYVCPPLTDELA